MVNLLNDIYTKHNKKFNAIFILLLILIPMLVAGYMRSYSYSLPITDSFAEQNVRGSIQNQIYSEVLKDYPLLPQQTLVLEVEKRTNEYYKTNSDAIQKQVKELSEYYKTQFKDEDGQTYLLEIDPYYHHTLAKNLYETGHKGDGFDEEGNSILYKRLAPVGEDASLSDFHTWMMVNMFKLNNLDPVNSTNGERTKAVYFLPALFSMLSIIPLFLIIRRYSSKLFAFMASLSLATMSTFLYRTMAGFVDTDAYNVFFPLLLMVLVLWALTPKIDFKNNLISLLVIIVAAAVQVVYLWAWGNAWFAYTFIILSLVAFTLYQLVNSLINKKALDVYFYKTTTLTILFTFCANALSYLISGQGLLVQSIRTLSMSGQGISVAKFGNIWPNVFSSVAELNPASFETIITSVGGKLFFFLAMMGLMFLALDFRPNGENENQSNNSNKANKIKKLKNILLGASSIWFLLFISKNFISKFNTYLISLTNNNPLVFVVLLFLPVALGLGLATYNRTYFRTNVYLVLLLSIWTAGTIFMSFQGVRFVLLLVSGFTIAFALGLYYVAKLINNLFNKYVFPFSEDDITQTYTHVGKLIHWTYRNVGTMIVCLLFILTFIPTFTASNQMAMQSMPGFDDNWKGLMDKINIESQEDAIITSWWDFGHYFINMADRGATFDGGAQTRPQAYWVGRLLMENDELVAKDILRMLVCGGNGAFEVMQDITNDSTGGVLVNKVLVSTFGKEDTDKYTTIKNNPYFKLSDEETQLIYDKLACEEPENFVIFSEDMVGKSAVWAHWGSWDFSKKYTLDYYSTLSPQQISERIDEPVEKINVWVEQLEEIDMRASITNVKRSDLVNQWLAPYPGYISISGLGTWIPCELNVQTNKLDCSNIVTIDLVSNTTPVEKATFLQQQTNKINRLIIVDIELDETKQSMIKQIQQEMQLGEQGGIDLLLKAVHPENSNNNTNSDVTYEIMLAGNPLGYSLFTKLFYLGLTDTDGFELFDARQSLNGGSIKTWKTKWTNTLD